MFTTGKLESSGSVLHIAIFDEETGFTSLDNATFEQLQALRDQVTLQMLELDEKAKALP